MKSPRSLAFAVLLLTGLFMAYGPVLVSGCKLVPAYSIDPRFNQYLMEHFHRWVSGDALHADLWSPPFFYPAKNVLGYSDAMIGLGWLYALIRGAGADPAAAYSIWVVILSAVNMAGFYLLARRWLVVSPVSASVASYVFAFGIPRMAQLAHPQLLSQVYVLLMLHGLLMASTSPDRRWHGSILFFAAAVLQFYTAFYHVWFAVFGLAWFVAAMALSREGRASLVTAARTPAWLVAGAFAFACAWPLVRVYLGALDMSGARSLSEVQEMLPDWRSWGYVGAGHWLYGPIYDRWPSLVPTDMTHEHVLGLGIVTGMVSWAGLASGWRRWWVRAALLACVMLMALSWRFSEAWNPWYLVMDVVPGASALRAVTRIALTLMIPWCFGIALLLDRIPRRWMWLLSFVIILEQWSPVPAIDPRPVEERVSRLAGELRKADAPAYVVVPVDQHYIRGKEYEFHIDAMWAGLEAGVPVVNGYSGLIPRDWVILYFNTSGGDEDHDRLRYRAEKWVAANPGDHESPVVVEWSRNNQGNEQP